MAGRIFTRRAPMLLMPALGVALLAGCLAVHTARQDLKGSSVVVATKSQVLDPGAGKDRRVVTGMDATAAKNTSEGYAKSFERQGGAQRAVVRHRLVRATQDARGRCGVTQIEGRRLTDGKRRRQHGLLHIGHVEHVVDDADPRLDVRRSVAREGPPRQRRRRVDK